MAEAAGVSKATVSFVINDFHPQVDRIPMKTRERIKACAEALGYRGSAIATALSTGKRMWIGVMSDLLPEDSSRWTWSPFFETSLLSGIQKKLAEHNYFTLLGLRPAEDEVEDLERLASADIGGLILKAAQSRAVKKAEELLNHGIPVLNVFPIERTDLYPHIVDLDNVAAGRMAAEIARECGSRNPAYITKRGHICNDRAKGLVEVMRTISGVDPAVCDLGHVNPATDDQPSITKIRNFISENRPDAIIALDGGSSTLLGTALDDLPFSIPDDLSVIGFDSLVFRTAKRQRISSVGVSWLHAGEEAAQTIIDSIEGKETHLPRLIPPIFVPGDTTPPSVSHLSDEEHLRALSRSVISP